MVAKDFQGFIFTSLTGPNVLSSKDKGQGFSSTQHYVEHSMRSYAQVSKHIVVYKYS